MRNILFNEGKIIEGILILIFLIIISFSCFIYKYKLDNRSLNSKVDSIRNGKNYVKIENIDSKFLNSMVAIEDHRFYSHGAVDFISIVRATVNNIKAGKVVQGGSTITQQLAKNMCLSNERSFKRKFKELFLAVELERKYSKKELLELYVNVINFGDGYVGIGEASEGYFGKKASNLNFDQATILAGLPQAPSRYALSNNNGLAKKRQKQVINALERYNGGKEKDTVVALELSYKTTN
ncbi:MAG: transglycosylase domain-containing protein [Clostridium sp.]|uniref:transglycosylase domain-containing protein n=1 Tax=Clostridium sp. TaxID=1506 RepID=UPI003F2B71E9